MLNESQNFAVAVDTLQSKYVRLRPVPLTAVILTDTFWAPRRRLNREVILPAQYRHCEETGRLDNLRRAGGKREVPFQGFFFNDSDVYKWLEAAAWTLATDDDPDLVEKVETVITDISSAQQPDGYLRCISTERLARAIRMNLLVKPTNCPMSVPMPKLASLSVV